MKPKHLFISFVLCFPLFLSVGCGNQPANTWQLEQPQIQQSIINGNPCEESVHPSALAVIMDAGIEVPWFGTQMVKQVSCTGTLIAPDVVLSGPLPRPNTINHGFWRSAKYRVLCFTPSRLKQYGNTGSTNS